MIPFVFFISSILIIAAVFCTQKTRNNTSKVSLITGALLYSAFCFVAYGKLSGLIPTVSIPEIVRQKGFDPGVLPISIEFIIQCGFLMGIFMNVVTSVWVFLRRGFWGWCLLMTAIFCVGGIVSGPFVGVSPVISLFGLCCGAMAVVGWVFGLTYVEFCVIGNIWVPCLGIIAASVYLIYGCLKGFGKYPVIAVVGIVFSAIEIVGMLALLWHYQGSMNEAFYTCVRDLRYIAAMAGTTYEVVNLVIYVVGSVVLMAIDIVGGKLMIRTNSLGNTRTLPEFPI
ncbi:MAG: hypothetical protein K2K75_03995 [Muribaculaceae bacterium]|nr:hypothetical protein [Muribaculaceae bacterium]